MPAGKVTSDKDVQPENKPESISLTESGRTIFCRLVQF